MKVQLYVAVSPDTPKFPRPLYPGDVVELPDELAQRYIRADYALAVDKAVTIRPGGEATPKPEGWSPTPAEAAARSVAGAIDVPED